MACSIDLGGRVTVLETRMRFRIAKRKGCSIRAQPTTKDKCKRSSRSVSWRRSTSEAPRYSRVSALILDALLSLAYCGVSSSYMQLGQQDRKGRSWSISLRMGRAAGESDCRQGWAQKLGFGKVRGSCAGGVAEWGPIG
ncbi:hypothetical protein BDU57DRAFT_190030 [Ampelomyces quisqualis]|uniref:Uncharacterized protein n=1 Tax=Ampelomyces quisqualis TaxID=50730 RepID=A0A6A5QS35_AMPQU|nr:hypothetical protein BDU57DRAFT_190030 [Ampelomyces quisqualis]